MTAQKTRRKPKPKSARPKGAQPGNRNALRHGFYQKHFTAEENKRLDGTTDGLDILAEINLLRTMIDRLAEQISFDEVSYMDDKGNQLRNDHYLQQLNTLSAMTQSRGTLVRTHYLTHGKSADVQSSILAALEELRLEMGI